MTVLIITAEELERLTGRKRPGAQQAWLRRNGLHYRVNDCGEVIVARAIAEEFLGVGRKSEAEADLDWPALHRLGIVSTPVEAYQSRPVPAGPHAQARRGRRASVCQPSLAADSEVERLTTAGVEAGLALRDDEACDAEQAGRVRRDAARRGRQRRRRAA